jgi:MFS-type transporter involved in bile tolerance (Atg22 family)
MGGIADRGAFFLLTSMTFHADLNSVQPSLTFALRLCHTRFLSSLCFFLPGPSSSPIWPLSRLLVIMANIRFGASIVVLNAYLPRLAVSSLPYRITAIQRSFSCTTVRISLLGIALGYTAGIFLLLVTVRAAGRGVNGCAAIRHWWLWSMMGVVFHNRSSSLAWNEGI